MGKGSLKASSAGIQKALAALERQCMTQKALAEELEIARSTVSNFFAGKAIRRSIFIEQICHFLELDWREIVQYPEEQDQQDSPSTPPQSDDDLIQQVREHCRQKILNEHSRMRLLSGEEIGVDQLYVDVWLLNRSPRTFQVSPNKLLETFDLRNDRLGLGDRIRRNPGFEVANANPKLVILGKPGSGKTTFLKHLAVDWCKGKFQPNLIAVLIELRRIRDEKLNLIEAIDQELGLEDWRSFQTLKQQIKTVRGQQLQNQNQIEALEKALETLPLQNLLKQGKLLVFMDGLDEVPTSKLRRDVQNQLRQIAENYPSTRLIMTCRTQIMEEIPVGFTSVEVADFSKEQIEQFVKNWFTAVGQSSVMAVRQWETFNHTVNNNPALKELTTTPVLLSLICLVLQDSEEISSQRNWLYQKGIKLLLSRWNDAKVIPEWELGSEAYRQLSIEEKEALLTEIAARKFENPKNFVLFEQNEIATRITQFLRFAKYREGVAVLKAIEAQHGLLIERADELWSFSHLTFQEYFTIQWLTQLPSEQLAQKIAKKQWQEAVKQILKSQQSDERLLQLIKRSIDQSVASEPKLQKFLTWVIQKSESVQANYKPVSIRAFYFALALALSHLSCGHYLARELVFGLDHDLALALVHNCVIVGYIHTFDCTLIRALDPDLDRVLAFERITYLSDRLALTSALTNAHAHALVLDSELANKLAQLMSALSTASTMDFRLGSLQGTQWETQWTEKLRQTMIEYRNIGHDWQFTKSETQQLQRYYDANKFLVELMKIEGAVSENVRAEIEDSLLLPWEELQRRQL